MNATRAATIRLRSSFDGAVSLGRVQTPTLAILTRREEEIRAFVPEPYWLVDAQFDADGDRALRGPLPRRRPAAHRRPPRRPRRSPPPSAASAARSPSSRRPSAPRSAPLLYDLTSLQREANTRYGFCARRTLGAAQRCYEEHKALTYPRTSSRYLTSDMVPELKPIAGHVGEHAEYAKAAAYVTGLDLLPLGRVVDDAKVGDHHAIIPTNAEHKLDEDGRRRPPHLRHGRPALPGRLPPRGRVREHARRDDGRRARLPHARQGAASSRAGAASTASWPRTSSARDEEDEGRDQSLPKLEKGEGVDTREVEVAGEGDQAAAALLRRVAAGRDGDRGQARRRRRAARGR